MPQAAAIVNNDNTTPTSVSYTLTPMGIENSWTSWKQTVPAGDTPMDGFTFYVRTKNPPLNTTDSKASRRTETKVYWRDTTVVDGAPKVTEQLFAEVNWVFPLTATLEKCEFFRHFLIGMLSKEPVKDAITKGYPLT